MKRAALLVPLLLLAAAPARSAPAFDPFAETAIDPPPGARVPTGRIFRDERNRPVTLGALGGGKPILLVPVLQACPNICEVTLDGVAQAIRAQPLRPGRDFALVAFGIDAREGPEAAAVSRHRLLAAFPFLGAAGTHGLTGGEADIRAVTDALGYRFAFNPEIGQVAHLSAAAVLTADGRLSRWLTGLSPDPNDLRLALAEAGEGKVGGLAEKLLPLCFRYDPVTGRYGATVWTLLRAGGTGTALALGAFIAAALLRERRRGRA